MTPAQLDLLLAAEHRLSAPPAGVSQRASDADADDLFKLAALARKGR